VNHSVTFAIEYLGKPLEIDAWLKLRTTNRPGRIWPIVIGNPTVTWPMTSRDPVPERSRSGPQSQPCVNGDASFLWELHVTFWLFLLSALGVRPQTDLRAKWLKWPVSMQGCAFCSKNHNFSYPLISRAPKRSQFRKFLDLGNFRSIWPLTLEVQRENTPYSSSDPNESGIVKRQSGGEKLKYVLKFYIGVHVTWYRACAMTF